MLSLFLLHTTFTKHVLTIIIQILQAQSSEEEDIELGESQKIKSLMQPDPSIKNHPAYQLLKQYSENGCPVECGDPWTQEHILEALKRGPHITARQQKAREELHKETKQKVKDGFAKVVKWRDLKDNIPKNLKLSPLAAAEHKSRPFRFILDLSFKLRVNNKELPSVNKYTKKMAPQESMQELGNVLKRIIKLMAQS